MADYFLDEFCSRNNFHSKQIDHETYEMLEGYSWPGNARELRNIIERMAILTPGNRLTPDSVPVEIRLAQEAGPALQYQGSARFGRTRAHPAGAGRNQLECFRRGARSGDGAHKSPQTNSSAWA